MRFPLIVTSISKLMYNRDILFSYIMFIFICLCIKTAVILFQEIKFYGPMFKCIIIFEYYCL